MILLLKFDYYYDYANKREHIKHYNILVMLYTFRNVYTCMMSPTLDISQS